MKTKNFYGWLAMAVMLVGTGCSTDEVVNDFSPKNAIQFGTYVGRDAESRGHVTSIENLASEGFGVFAYYTAQQTIAEKVTENQATPNFMYNQKVESNSGAGTTSNNVASWSGTWEYTPLKYWPNNVNDKVSFYAYAPYSAGGEGTNFILPSSTTTGKPTLKFKVGTDVEKHQDLLFAAPAEDKSKNSNSPVDIDDKINFDFKHALARIGFKAEVMVDYVNGDKTGEADDDNTTNGTLDTHTTITINSVKLIGKFYKEGVMKLEDGTWTLTNNSTPGDGDDVTFELKSETPTETSDFATRKDNNGTPINDANIFTEDDIEIRQLNNDENYIMIIPQDFTNDNLAGSLKMVVVYDVFTDDNGNGNEDANDSKITNTITSDPFDLKFEQGKAYSLNIHIGMTSVKFSATVTNWAEQTGNVVNVPLNTGN